MSIENITRAQAQERSKQITTKSYEVVVDLSGRYPDGSQLESPDTTFVQTTTARFSSTGEPTWIDVIGERVLSAYLDSEPIDVSSYQGSRLEFSPSKGDHELTVTSLMRYSRTGEGLHRFVDPTDGKISLYSQFESADARRMYATFEQPDLKATFQLTLIAPAHWVAISNSPTPQPEILDGDMAKWTFSPTPPISTYLTALVAGEYHVEQGTIKSIKGDIPAAVVCRPSMAQYLDADRIREATQRGFEVYEEAFGREYAFEKYDQIFVPEFNFGAMENVGCVTFRDQYLFRSKVSVDRYDARDNTILHELAHMWFGDLVTMKWWNDIWLNESFAEWSAYFCQGEIAKKYGGRNPWVTFANARKAWAYRADQLPSTHPIANEMVDLDAVDQNFDGITYAKGASVLKQLVSLVGEDNFLSGVREYFEEHAWGNTEFDDLLSALEKASGKDLSGFTSDWLQTAGVNTIYPKLDLDDDGTITNFEVIQKAPKKHDTLRNHKIAIGLYELTEDGKLVATESMPVDVHGSSTPIAALVGRKAPDLVLLNDRDLGYVKVRLDEASMATASKHLKDMPDPMARVMVWTAMNNALRDAELPSKGFLNIVLQGLAGEDDDSAIRNELAQLSVAASSYSHPDNRANRKATLVAGLTEHLMHAQPGSDSQLAFADALVNAIGSPAGADLLQGWLKGEDVPEGLPIDSDRRWLIIKSLARIGVADETLIAKELEADNTISGAQSAAGARACLKDAAAKADAWAQLTEVEDLPNHTYSEISENFWNYGQEDITAPYADKYLEILEQMCQPDSIWARRGHVIRTTALSNLWPYTIADEAWLDRVQAFIASHKVPDEAMRALSEEISLSKRAIKAQQLDAENA